MWCGARRGGCRGHCGVRGRAGRGHAARGRSVDAAKHWKSSCGHCSCAAGPARASRRAAGAARAGRRRLRLGHH
eukprot:7369336-Pyramimonas_sp.AAC.1